MQRVRVAKANINLALVIAEHRPLRREPVTLRLPFPPSVNNLFFNVGRSRARTKLYDDWIREASFAIRFAGSPRVNGPVEITMTFLEKSGRHDLDNLPKAVLDCLVSMRVIDADDSKIVRKITLQWGGDSGVTVEIAPADQPGAAVAEERDWVTRRNMARAG